MQITEPLILTRLLNKKVIMVKVIASRATRLSKTLIVKVN